MLTKDMRFLSEIALSFLLLVGCGGPQPSSLQETGAQGEAIVFIPGIASTNLAIAQGSEQKSLDILAAIRAKPEAIAAYLDPFQVDENGQPFRPATPRSLAFLYTVAANQLRKQGVTVYEFGYDWRKDIDSAAQDLESYINKLPHKKVNLLTMSMGGLIATKYLERDTSKVDKFISLGTPFLGSSKSLQFLLTGTFLGSTGQKAEEFRKFMKSIPSLYQTLPGRKLGDAMGQGALEVMVKDQDSNFRNIRNFDESNNLLGSTDRVNPRVLQNTQNFLDSMDYEKVLTSVRTYFVVGDSVKTVNKTQLVLAKGNSSYRVTDIKFPEQDFVSGDDTTTITSATINGLAAKISPNRVYYMGSPHINLLISGDILNFIVRLTKEGAEQPIGKMRLQPEHGISPNAPKSPWEH